MKIEELIIGCILLLLLIVICIATTLLAYTSMPHIEKHMKKSVGYLETLETMKHGGITGKSIMCGLLALVFLIPDKFATKGFVDLDDINRFPKGLKRKIVIIWYSSSVVIITFVLFGWSMGWT